MTMDASRDATTAAEPRLRVGVLGAGMIATIAFAGSTGNAAVPGPTGERYRPSEPFTAVLPSPKTSHDTPNRGSMSFQFGTFWIASKLRAGVNGPAGRLCSSTDALSMSRRTP